VYTLISLPEAVDWQNHFMFLRGERIPNFSLKTTNVE
jgi:hypothetical protein